MLLSLGSLPVGPKDVAGAAIRSEGLGLVVRILALLLLPGRSRVIVKKKQRYSHVAQKLSCLSPTAAKERAHGNRCLPVRQVRVERLVLLPDRLVKLRDLDAGPQGVLGFWAAGALPA